VQQQNPAQRQQSVGPQRSYGFLVSGKLQDGPRINATAVSPDLIAQMDKQITTWEEKLAKKGNRAASVTTTATRCIDSRWSGLGPTKALAADDVNNSVACPRCIKRKQLCVLVGAGGPTIVPLPLQKAPGVDSAHVGYYLKQ